jgi:hypothetical protein
MIQFCLDTDCSAAVHRFRVILVKVQRFRVQRFWVEPQNVEGWICSRSAGACAAGCSVFLKIDRIHSFDPPAAEHS